MACTGFACSRAGSGVKATEVLKGRFDAEVDLVYCETSRRDDSTIDAIRNASPEGTHVALLAYSERPGRRGQR